MGKKRRLRIVKKKKKKKSQCNVKYFGKPPESQKIIMVAEKTTFA